jgi:uncharacterized protein YfiM (DUF2279 family)
MLPLIACSLITATPADLELHAAASALISADVYALAVARDAPVSQRLLLAGGVSLGLGATKELLWDRGLGLGEASWADFGADVLGTAAGLALSLAIDWMLDLPK